MTDPVPHGNHGNFELMKPWREIIVPHPDVLNGTFQQSEFAADLTAVWTGKATTVLTRTRHSEQGVAQK